MQAFIEIETVIVLLLAVVSLVALAVRRVRVPYTVALVLVGLVISFEEGPEFAVTPELILALFVPPLVFQAAFHLEIDALRENLGAILTLAVPGVLLCALIVAGVVAFGVGLPLSIALVFGALISATDPVAVIALFRTLGVPRRLAVAVEGESLFNDGTAIVIFQIALAAALTGSFSLVGGVIDFLWVSLGGLGIGLVLGFTVSRLIAQIDDYFIEITLTTVLAYGSYLLAEQMHVSGVLAVVAAGLICGNLGPAGMSPTTKVVLYSFWEYLAFLVNSLVFLLIGLRIEIADLLSHGLPIAVAVGSVLASRAVVVYGLLWLARGVDRGVHVPVSWQHVLVWGGLRGAVSLALALSLPAALPDRDLLQVMAFGVVLFTLVGQGTTIQVLLRRMGLAERPSHIVDHELQLGRLYATQAALRRLADRRRAGLLDHAVWAGLRDEYGRTRQRLAAELSALFVRHRDLQRDMVLGARRDALQAERAALAQALRQGLITETAYRQLIVETDQRLATLTGDESVAPPDEPAA
jgi:CPA1 family monovalent cation:H+ antiporter